MNAVVRWEDRPQRVVSKLRRYRRDRPNVFTIIWAIFMADEEHEQRYGVPSPLRPDSLR